MDVSVRTKSKHGFGVANFLFLLDVIIKQEVIYANNVEHVKQPSSHLEDLRMNHTKKEEQVIEIEKLFFST